MPTTNQISNLPFETNLVLNGLNSPDKTALVYDFSNGYNTLDMLMSLKGIQAKQVTGLDGKHEKPIFGRSNVVQQILSNAQAGLNLRVNFVDTTYELFRIGDTVFDSNAAQTKGRVISKGPGFVVLEPQGGTLTAATDFVANRFISRGWDSSQNKGSTSKETLYEFPTYTHNFTAITRETSEIFRRDKAQTYPMFNGKFWYSAQDVIAIQRFAKARGVRDLLSERGQFGNPTVNQNGGLKWAIQDVERGGIYRPLSNVMNEADFINFITDVADKQASSMVELTLCMGRQALATIQQFANTSNSIQFAGNTNTFGGTSVQGLDIRQYVIAGVKANLVLDPLMNDAEVFPSTVTVPGVRGTRMQNTIIALDLANYNTVDGKSVPAMERIYFGDKEYEYGILYGVGMGGPTGSNGGAVSGNVISSSRDNIQMELYSDCGIDVMATRMGWMEYA